MSEITAFFKMLAERKYQENDLSDVTYALCKSHETFRQTFLSFCFEEEVDTDNLMREYAFSDSRPDFRFYDKNNKERIIEVKINDSMNHFEQYENTFPHAKHALIANYKCKNREGWVIKTWKEFYEKLNTTDLTKDELVKGYVEYLKVVVCVKEFKKVKLNICKDLVKFYDNLEVVVRKYNFTTYNSGTAFAPHCYGRFFYKDDLYFWFGLYFEENTVYLGFNNDDSWVPLPILKKLRELKEGEDFEQVGDGNRGFFWFSLDEQQFKILCDDGKGEITLEQQSKVLEDFFIETMKKIGAEEYLN